MKRFVLLLLMFGILTLVSATTIYYELEGGKTSVNILSHDETSLHLNYNIAGLSFMETETEQGIFVEMYIQNYAFTDRISEPKLPLNKRLITVPVGAEVIVRNLNYMERMIRLDDLGLDYSLIPLQPSISKCPDAEIPPFEIDEKTYQTSGFYGFSTVEIEEIGILRGNRVLALKVNPVSYDPVARKISVLSNLYFELEFINGDLQQTVYNREKTFSPYFEPVIRSALLNYTELNSRTDLTNYPVSYVIISDPMFEDQLTDFIQWKTEKGFNVILGFTDNPEVGSTTTSIKNFLQDIYDSATPQNPAPSFVLFVGDVAQIPPFTGNTGNHVTDLHYVRLEGDDYLPDMYYGRFSANNPGEFQPQIDKTLFYEKLETDDPSYLAESVLIAGHDSYWASSHGNGHINYGTEHYFNEDNGSYPYVYLYPQSSGSSQQIIQNVSNGVGYVNYTAHGSPTSWADPSFTINDINNLQNYGKYPMVVGNCCITNKFDLYQCFGEAWLRAENKGAIGYIGGNDNTYWNEDYWWGVGHVASIPGHGNALPYESTGPGMFDGLFHTHGEDFENWYVTGGAMILSGNLAVEMSNSTRKNYYWEIYSLMGDPSLTPFMREPLENDFIIPDVVFLGLDTIQIIAEPYSYVGLSKDGILHGAGIVPDSGLLNLEYQPFQEPGEALLVITLQNHAPVIEEIPVIPSEGAYIVLESFEVSSDEHGNQAVYGDTVTLNLNLSNVGEESAAELSLLLESSDDFATIVENHLEIDEILPEDSVQIEDAFLIEFASNIPDQHMVNFIIGIVDSDGNQWQSNFNIYVNAPEFTIGEIIVDDSGSQVNPNNQLDPGESAMLMIPTSNTGSAVSPETTVYFYAQSDYIVINSASSLPLGQIDVTETLNLPFFITVSEEVPPGSSLAFGLVIISGDYTKQHSFYLPVGLLYEDFETGDFSSFDWQFSGTQPWVIDTSQVYDGTYSARSGQIGNSQTSVMYIVMDVPIDGEISFYKLVSSEANYDFLKFYINNQEQGSWSGTNDTWSHEVFPVSAGVNTFRWSYLKDQSVSHGSDCAWIDNIVFPASGYVTEGPFLVNLTEEINFGYVLTGDSYIKELTMQNLGADELTGTIISSENFMVSQNRDEHVSFSIPPFSPGHFSIVFFPSEHMFYDEQITILSNDENNPELFLDVRGYGFFPAAPEEFNAEVEYHSVYLTWEPPDYGYGNTRNFGYGKYNFMTKSQDSIELLGYNLYRDDIQLNIDVIDDLFYPDEGLEEQQEYVYYVTALYNLGESDGSEEIIVKILSTEEADVATFVTGLEGNYPNPFNPDTVIKFSLNDDSLVRIEVFNVRGQRIITLLNEFVESGNHQIVWSGLNEYGKPVGSGLYFYRMKAGEFSQIKKMMLIK